MRKCATLIFIVLAACLLAGCQKREETNERQEGVYKIYYLNSALNKLESQDYRAKSGDADILVQELMEQFMEVPMDLDYQTALPDKIELRRFHREDTVLYLYFDDSYNTSMDTTREILCRAALAKTLGQVAGVDFINIYAGEQPLLDDEGAPVGMITASDFVDSISDINTFEKTELTLFFADEKGEELLQEKREVVHSVNTSLERLVVEQLILGPETPGLYPTLSRDTKLLGVSVNENICYINFDQSFLNGVQEVRDYIPIYSIVNSLSALSTVNKVQFTVGGSKDVKYRDSISLNALFERNLDYIGGDYN